MGTSNTKQGPSPWEFLHDDTKTVITLATAFLGLTVTFSDKLLQPEPTIWEIGLLVSTWMSLCVVIITGIIASAGISTYLRGKTANANSSMASLNIAFYSLVLAAVLFIIFGGIQISERPQHADASSSVTVAVQLLASTYANSGGDWIAESLIWNKTTQEYQIVVVNDSIHSKFLVVVEGESGEVTRFERQP